MATLFQSVIWPAVAGNVAWAFFTVLLQEWAVAPRPEDYCSRLGLLAALAVYLCLDWTHTESIKPRLRKWYWVGDLFLASAIAALAIAAQARVGDGRWFLLAVFAVSAISHLCGAWTEKGKHLYRDQAWKHRLSWLLLNAVAAGMVIGFGGDDQEWGWNLFFAAAVVIVCWALAKPAKVPQLKWLSE